MSTNRVKTRWRREFDHTGDLGIEAQGESLAAVFEEAALGMFGLLSDLESVTSVQTVEISMTAESPGELLHRWLSELNFLHLTGRVLFARFDVSEISETGLKATAHGESIDPGRHQIHTEIKAVTHHEMIVRRRNDSWYARIIFDV